MVPVLLPLELPEPMLPLDEPLEPVLGEVLGEVLGDVLELPLVPPLLAPDLLKCASHSEREICPSLLLSTDEKLGVEAELLLPDRPPLEDEVSDEPLALPPDAAGEDDDLSLLVLLEELCATATLERANNAAAVAALMSLRFKVNPPSDGWE